MTAPTSTPTVTISILVMEDTARLRKCLQSIARATLPGQTEILVTGNGTAASALDALQQDFPEVRILRSAVNRGFAGGHMGALAASSGEFFLFLNDDVTVAPDWLAVLAKTLRATPDAAAVGSRLTFPDGRIQEAGMSIWQDGTTIPIGRGLPATSLTYDYCRDVDYCSACSLLVRRSALLAVGGMSDAYYPAYYEDADLALRFRMHGYRILYEPRSVVIHEESKSTPSTKRHLLLERNRELFCRIWKDELHAYDPPPSRPESSPLADALMHAIWRAQGYPPRVCITAGILPDAGGTSAEAHLDALLENLSRTSAITLALPEQFMRSIACETGRGMALRRSCQDRGIQLLAGSLSRHLSHPAVTYDFIIAGTSSLLEEGWKCIRGGESVTRAILDLRLHDGNQDIPEDLTVPLAGLVLQAGKPVTALPRGLEHAVSAVEADAWYGKILERDTDSSTATSRPMAPAPFPSDAEARARVLPAQPSNLEVRMREMELYSDLLERSYSHATAQLGRRSFQTMPVLLKVPGLRSAYHAVQRARGVRKDPPFLEWEDLEQ